MNSTDHHNPVFRFYGALWANDLRARGGVDGNPLYVPLDCDADWEALWKRFEALLDTTVDPPKAGRWYSINNAEWRVGTNFWPMKLVLRVYLEIDDELSEVFEDPSAAISRTPQQELRLLKSKMGGLPLAHRLMTPWLHFMIRAYYHVTNATWSWYAQQRSSIRSAVDGLRSKIECSRGGWKGALCF